MLSSFTLTGSPSVGRIVLPSTILQFWDLGGQRDIRNIWERYYDECHAVVYVVDASDVERMSEGWEIFGSPTVISHSLVISRMNSCTDAVLNHPRIMGLPLLLLANKQDIPNSFSVEAIRGNYEEWWQLRNAEEAHRLGGRQVERRMASLNVMGVSAIEG